MNKNINHRGRKRITRAYIEDLARRLSDRDRDILATLDQVRVATGRQLDQLHFGDLAGSSRSRRRRAVLSRLSDHELIHALDRRVGGIRGGSDGLLWVLGRAGQRLLHRERRARRPLTPSWPFLSHALGVTDLLVRLSEAEDQGRLHLVAFRAEPAAWLAVPGRPPLKPDATATVDVGTWRYQLAFEVDRGTESLTVIAAQLARYEEAYRLGVTADDSSVFPRVIWCVPSSDRAAGITSVIERLSHPELFSVHLPDDVVATIIVGPEARSV